MKKKLMILTIIIVVLVLISSTAFADPPVYDYNGNCINYFTTRTSSIFPNYWDDVYDDCEVCYVTIGTSQVNCSHQSYLVDSDGYTCSPYMYVSAGQYGSTEPYSGGTYRLRIRNYQYYGQYEMHTEGQWGVGE